MEKQKNKERDLLKKAFLFLLLVGFSCLSVWSQNRGDYVTMTVKSERLTDVIREIEKATDYKIIFAFDDVQQYRVSATLDNVSAPKALRILLAGKPLSFTVDGKYIRVFEDKSKGISQTGFFKGKVVDTDGSPLPGVSVKIKGSNLGTITNLDGVFNIDAHGEDTQTFVFTFLGKKSVERKFKSGDGQVIKMIDDVNTFDDVVVTGYQTVSKRELASAISTVKAKDVMVDGAASIDQMLQGRVPGMAVINTSGEPSATPKIRIRGNATINGNKSPVWVVDGVIQEQDIPFSAASINSEDAEYLIGNAISGLNPQDIETITVLKDASATAIYGVKAANGVIIITTKRGYSGKPVITYNGDVTLNTRPSYDNYNLMNSQERVAFSKSLVDAGMEAGRTPVGETYEGAYEDLLSKASTLDEFKQRVAAMQTRNTDWFKYLFRNSVTTTHTANISGGSDKVRYYMSAGYSDIQGSSKASDEQKFNVLGRIDAEINSHINFQAKFNYSNVSNKGYKSSVNPFDYAYSTSRTLPVYNEDGSYYMNYAKGGYSGTKNIGYNVLKELENTGKSSKMDNFDALFRLNVKFIEGLTYEGTFAISNSNTSTREWATEQSYYIGANFRRYDYGQYTAYDSEYWDSELPYGGILTQSAIRKTGYTLRNQIEFRRTFGDHGVDVLGGIEARRNAYKGLTSTGYGWTPEYGEQFNPVLTDSYEKSILESGATNPVNTNTFTQVASFYGVASYAYMEKYIFNFNIRSDGSNKFGSNPKYRWLPTYSFALRWNMMKENFLKDVSWIDNLDMRASYGVQGNINENDSPFLILNVGSRDNVLGLPISTISKLPNPDLRWEKTHSWDLALDFSLLNGRFRGGIDFYGKKTKDLIITKTIASSNGTTAMDYNAGKMKNTGYEGFINVGVYKNKDWEWRLGTNFSHNINKVTYANLEDFSSTEIIDKMLAGNLAINGDALGTLYAYHFAGINDDIGYPMFYTKDGKKSIVGSKVGMELVKAGSIYPKLTGGFDTELTYKNLSLSMNFTYSYGSVARLPKYFTSSDYIDPMDNVSKEWLSCWKQSGDNTIYPAPYNYVYCNDYLSTAAGAQYDTYDANIKGAHVYSYTMYNYSDIRVAKADFIKLKLVSLSYRLPGKYILPLNIKSLMFRLQATNLFTIADKKWHGLDPETGGTGIPSLPTYSLSVNVSF